MTEKIASIINYCSNDYPFLKECVTQAKKFSKKVLVVVSDHFFDGQKEDIEKLKNSFSELDFATFIIYPFIPEKIPKRILNKVRKNSMWHSISRMVASFCLEKEIEYLLFLDVDEIIDGDKFKEWLQEKSYLNYEALRPANYWYFRSTSSQAIKWEDSAIFVKRKKMKIKSLLDSRERDAIFDSIKGKKIRNVVGLDNLPMIHHYSWVKTKQQMQTKIETWGHKDDKNWKDLIEKEFQKDSSNKDFVHGYDLINVPPFVNIDINSIPKLCTEKIKNNGNNILYLSEKKLLNIIIKRSIKDYIYCYLDNLRHLFKKIKFKI